MFVGEFELPPSYNMMQDDNMNAELLGILEPIGYRSVSLPTDDELENVYRDYIQCYNTYVHKQSLLKSIVCGQNICL